MIKPTVGRVVWFWPASRDFHSRVNPDDPLAALIAAVHDDVTVSLTVLQQDGLPASATNVRLWHGQEVEPRPTAGSFCEWMPYQKGQAAKTEALEQKLGANS